MKEEFRALINYRLERARETLDEANILLEQGYANTFVNRLYYACFYAVSALLLTKGLSFSKHSGLRSYFHQHFVKPGLVEIELGQLFDKLFDNRQKGDYADYVRFKSEEIRHWYNEAKEFVNTIENLVKQSLDLD